MNRLLVAVLFTLGFIPTVSSAVEISNIRVCHGPFGATRKDAKFLPGDVLFMTYDIEGLVIDAKTGQANYDTILELVEILGGKDKDGKENIKVPFKNGPTPNNVVPHLGGARIPGDLFIELGQKQSPGNYEIRLTVNDKNGKVAKRFRYPFEVVKETFGFVRVSAPAVKFVGEHYVTGFGMVNLKLDGKGKANAELTMRVLDEKGKQVAEPMKWAYPRDLPANLELKETNFVPVSHGMFMNRPGRFTIEVEATDNNAKTKATLRYPVTVLDVSSIAK